MTLKEMSARFDRTVAVFTKCHGRVLHKFLIDMVLGILKSQSVQLASIARGLTSEYPISAKHLFKRLDRNLGQHDLSEIKNRVQKMQSAMIDADTLIYFDPTDLVKPYAQKMEALCHVADGSKDHEIRSGYPSLACVAMREGDLIPLEWSPYSYKAEDFESENEQVLRPIITIARQAKCRGTFILDRGFDRFAVIRHVAENGISFIIRMQETRHYHLPGKTGQSYSRQEIMQFATTTAEAYLNVRIKKKLTTKLFSIQAVPVRLHGGKIESAHPLHLVRACATGLMTLYFLTNLEITPETLSRIVANYLARWKVEEFIRFVKQQYGAEKFLVRDLGRIKNLFSLLFIALVVLTRMGEFPVKFSKTRALLIREAKRVFKIPQKMRFFLYTIAEGLSQVLKKLTKSVVQLWRPPPKNQLSLAFGRIL